MAICPKDLKPCCDDICYGSGCMLLPGVSMLTHCSGCGQLVSVDGSDDWECECEDDYNEGEDENPLDGTEGSG